MTEMNGHIGAHTEVDVPEPIAIDAREIADVPVRPTEKIAAHTLKAARRREQQLMEVAKRSALMADQAVALGHRSPVKQLTYYLAANYEDSTNEFHLPNTNEDHERFLSAMGTLGYTLRCPTDDETIEYLIDSDGKGFERVLGDPGDPPTREGEAVRIWEAYKDRLPVEYHLLPRPIDYHGTKPVTEPSPADPV